MGKRKSNIGGLARYVFEAVAESSSSSGPQPSSSSTSGPTDSPQTKTEHENNSTASTSTQASDSLDTRPKKKQKLQTGLLGPGLERFDATGLVPFYTDASQVPGHLQKYFSQRERFFSRYASGCLMDEEGWYSVTPEAIADQIAERCRCDVILDAFCGVGGNAIAFAKSCERVIALDISPVRLALARHNAALYGVEDRIEFVLADFFSFARTLAATSSQSNALGKPRARRKIDVVFLSPPWGGPSYLSGSGSTTAPTADSARSTTNEAEVGDTYADYSLECIRPVHGKELFEVARGITKNIAYFLPRNTKLEEISGLVTTSTSGSNVGGGVEMVEVEEEWMGSKLKALCCYFGGLVGGQEGMFEE